MVLRPPHFALTSARNKSMWSIVALKMKRPALSAPSREGMFDFIEGLLPGQSDSDVPSPSESRKSAGCLEASVPKGWLSYHARFSGKTLMSAFFLSSSITSAKAC